MLASPVFSSKVVALKAFDRIASRWNLKDPQRATLLAANERTIRRWRETPEKAEPTRDQIERISYLLGIFSGLRAILGETPLADDWVLRPNLDFGDRPPLDRMLAGNVGDLAFVRGYVDRWRASW